MTGKAGITKDVEGFIGKSKEIVLFKALHLVLSDKSRERRHVLKAQVKSVIGMNRRLSSALSVDHSKASQHARYSPLLPHLSSTSLSHSLLNANSFIKHITLTSDQRVKIG